MKKQRFVLTYTGEGVMPGDDLTCFNEQIAVLNHSSHSLLVEDLPAHLNQLLLTMPQWKAGPERMYKRLNAVSMAPFRVTHDPAESPTLLP